MLAWSTLWLPMANAGTLNRFTAGAVFSQSSAIADLDDDGRPDLAFSTTAIRTRSSAEYRIEIKLSSQDALVTFTLSGDSDQTRISPEDIDGDRDLDLVLRNVWTGAPLALWINDGKGHFHEGNLDQILTRRARSASVQSARLRFRVGPLFTRDDRLAFVTFGKHALNAAAPVYCFRCLSVGLPFHLVDQGQSTRAPPSMSR